MRTSSCRVILAAFAALSVASLSCEESERRPVFRPEETRVELGLGGAHVDGEWNTLFVEVTNRGATFDGTIRITGALLQPDPVTYETRIEVPEGETRRLTVPVRTSDWSRVTLRYRQDGRPGSGSIDLAHSFELRPGTSVATRLLAVGNRLPDLTPVAKEVEASHLPPPQNAPIPPIDSRCEVTRLRPSELPRHWSAYHPFQIVLLYDTALLDAPTGAATALASWVARGGSLVVFPGPASASGIPPALAELLGAAADPPGAAPERVLRALGSPELEGYYRRWQPGPDARESDLGLSVTSWHGAGRVTTFNFTPAGGAFPGPAEAAGIYSDLAPTIVRSRSAFGNPAASLRAIETLIASRLFDLTSFKTPAGAVVTLGLALYLLLGFFVPGYIFKRRGRRELTFVTGIVAALLATAAVYRFGALNFGFGTEVAEVSLVRLHRRGHGAELTSFVGVLSPRHASFELLPRPAGPEPLGAFTRSASPLRGQLLADYRMDRLQTPPTTLRFDRRGRVSLPRIELRPNGIRCFRVDDRIAAQDLVTVDYAHADDGRISGVTVRNVGGEVLFGMVIDGWECFSLGWLAPRKERDCLSLPEEGWTSLDTLQLGWIQQELPLLRSGRVRAVDALWLSDGRAATLKTIIVALISEARGLGFAQYAWQGLVPGNTTNQQRGLKPELRPHEPRTLILVGSRPMFECGETKPERRALTCVVLELPSRAETNR